MAEELITASSILKEGNTAVVTGASSGIGRAACLDFASRGMKVWMVDIDKDDLEAAAKLAMDKAGGDKNIKSRVVDVSDTSAMENLAKEVFDTDKKCHLLMNNAGIMGVAAKCMSDMKLIQKTVNVNTYGPINGCLAFCEKMKASGEPGIIVNTGSKQGITMPPGNIAYNMSKAALKCYTEGLEHELMLERRSDTKCKIRAALLVPGWVNTSIAVKKERDVAKEKGETFDVDKVFFHEDKPAKDAWMPKQVVDFMIQELDKGLFYIMCPDNDVDRETDNLRMTWTMQDITQDRPPLSRWHPDHKDKFTAFLAAEKGKK